MYTSTPDGMVMPTSQGQYGTQTPIPCRCDAASQTAPMYSTDPDGTVTLTLAEAERLWAQKHEKLEEFGGMLSSQAEQYEEQLAAHISLLRE